MYEQVCTHKQCLRTCSKCHEKQFGASDLAVPFLGTSPSEPSPVPRVSPGRAVMQALNTVA